MIEFVGATVACCAIVAATATAHHVAVLHRRRSWARRLADMAEDFRTTPVARHIRRRW